MKRTTATTLRIGLFIFIAVTIVERFIMPISDWIAIPLIILAIILIIMGGLKNEKN